MTRVLTEQEETPLEANVLDDYMDTFNKELTVETATLGKSADYVKTESDEPKGETETSEGVQHVESLERDKMSVDSCAVDVQVGYNVEILVVDTEDMPSGQASSGIIQICR